MSTKIVAILQSNYIPWKGYFDIIGKSDLFLLFDEAQFTRRDWRNRNIILLNGAPFKLTIPLKTKGNYHSAICDMKVSDHGWAEKHWKTIQQAYSKAPHYARYREALEEAYEKAAGFDRLSEINLHFLRLLMGLAGIDTLLGTTQDVPRTATSPTGRLVEICKAKGATHYFSGPAARAYMEPELFEEAGIELLYADYSGYEPYPQMSTTFDHHVSMIDTLMMCGPETRDLLLFSSGRKFADRS